MAEYDCLIIGAGPVALAMARALNMRGLTFALCGQLPPQRPDSPDQRTAALFDGSIQFLSNIGVWTGIEHAAAPLSGIRIIDATGRLLRAPEQLFSAGDINAKHLGFNVPNPLLISALRETLEATQPITKKHGQEINLTADVTNVRISEGAVTITLGDQTTRTGRMAIAADGRKSLTREAASIDVKTWSHDQAALTTHFEHELPNNAISTEIQTTAGPCTTVPLSAHRSSLVWMERPAKTAALAELEDDAFMSALERRLDGLLGPIMSVGKRRVFPLSSLIAEKFAANRVALIGESGHAFPPIGAQGLNLGLRDVAELADKLANARNAGRDIGSDATMEAYSQSRRADITARTYGVDAFNASLSSDLANMMRGAAFHALHASPNIKRFLIDRGMRPVGAWPTMMR